jgi:hypothetical protein
VRDLLRGARLGWRWDRGDIHLEVITNHVGVGAVEWRGGKERERVGRERWKEEVRSICICIYYIYLPLTTCGYVYLLQHTKTYIDNVVIHVYSLTCPIYSSIHGITTMPYVLHDPRPPYLSTSGHTTTHTWFSSTFQLFHLSHIFIIIHLHTRFIKQITCGHI